MKTKLVNFKLPLDLIEKIEELSEGNKTALVVDLLNQAISMRGISDNLKKDMYEAAISSKNINFSSEDMRNLINGLHS